VNVIPLYNQTLSISTFLDLSEIGKFPEISWKLWRPTRQCMSI